jgi:hypothetical protein
MKIKKIESYYIITKIKEHNQFKNTLLSLIDKMPLSKHDDISKTDWNLPSDFKREYLELFFKIINPYMTEMSIFLKEPKWYIYNGWYQQYTKNDFHKWHRHNRCNFTNVYYLEMPDKRMNTKLKVGKKENKIISIDAREGDLVTFPANILHTSIKINNKRKTIISFNSDFGE